MGLSIASGVAFWDHAPEVARGVPLVLVHGAGGTHLHWPEAIRTLPGRRVLAVDLPGHGQAPLPGETTIPGYAGAILGMLDALGIPRAVVAGHSMGGAVALSLAMDAPDRVAGLFLVGTGARLRVAPAILEGSADPARSTETAEAMAAFSFGPSASAEARAAHVRAVAAQPAGVLHDDLAACDAFDAMARLGSIRAPTFVVVGEEDRLTPPKYAAFLRERLPGEGLLLVPGAGHMVATEAPAEVTAAAAAFLERVPA
jgi:pimeloyl-ACP methyl ester carboxylesterase